MMKPPHGKQFRFSCVWRLHLLTYIRNKHLPQSGQCLCKAQVTVNIDVYVPISWFAPAELSAPTTPIANSNQVPQQEILQSVYDAVALGYHDYSSDLSARIWSCLCGHSLLVLQWNMRCPTDNVIDGYHNVHPTLHIWVLLGVGIPTKYPHPRAESCSCVWSHIGVEPSPAFIFPTSPMDHSSS